MLNKSGKYFSGSYAKTYYYFTVFKRYGLKAEFRKKDNSCNLVIFVTLKNKLVRY